MEVKIMRILMNFHIFSAYNSDISSELSEYSEKNSELSEYSESTSKKNNTLKASYTCHHSECEKMGHIFNRKKLWGFQ